MNTWTKPARLPAWLLKAYDMQVRMRRMAEHTLAEHTFGHPLRCIRSLAPVRLEVRRSFFAYFSTDSMPYVYVPTKLVFTTDNQ